MTQTDSETTLRQFLRDVPDFPKPGILFKDITPLLQDADAFARSVDFMANRIEPGTVHRVASPEARGFLFGTALALRLGVGFVPIRKPGKLPYESTSVTYELEYGEDSVHMHVDAVSPGDRVLLVDDVLATGGTMKACTDLVEGRGAHVSGCMFLLELGFLNGRDRLKDYQVDSLLRE